MSFVALARSEMLVYIGYTMDMRMAMIASTTITSIRVKACAKWEFSSHWSAWLGTNDIWSSVGSESEKELRKRKMLDNTLSSSCM